MAAAALALCLALPLSGCNWEEWFKQNGGTYPPVSSSSSVSDSDEDDGEGGGTPVTPTNPNAPENWPVDENGKLTIPNGVTSVSLNDIQTAAAGKNVTAVELPGSVTSVDLSGAGLKQLADNVTVTGGGNIKSVNLSGCSGVSKANLDKLIPNPGSVESINLSGAQMNTVGNQLFKSFSGLKSVDLSGSNIKSIGENAISNCPRLESIDLSDCTSLTSIGTAFKGTNIKTVNLSGCDNLTALEGLAFCNCKSLENIELPEKLTNIEYTCFSGCSSLKTVHLPDGVTELNSSVFSYCSNLQSINLSNITSIKTGAFTYCTSLRSADLSNVTTIENMAFYSCTNLVNVTFSKDLTSIGQEAFYMTALKKADLSECTKLFVPGSNEYGIRASAFNKCNNLSEVELYCPANGTLTFWGYVFGRDLSSVPMTLYLTLATGASDRNLEIKANAFDNNNCKIVLTCDENEKEAIANKFTERGLTVRYS